MAKKRKNLDKKGLVELEMDYRSGLMSDSDLSRKYDVTQSNIIYHAKSKGWTRNLCKDINDEAQRQLIKNEYKNNLDSKLQLYKSSLEEEIFTEAAGKIANIILKHRDAISAAREIEEKIFSNMAKFMSVFDGIKVMALDDVMNLSKTYKNLVDAQGKRINLERQAYNIKDDDITDGKDHKIEKIEIEFHGGADVDKYDVEDDTDDYQG